MAGVNAAAAAFKPHAFDLADFENLASAVESYVYQLYSTEGVLLAAVRLAGRQIV
jgi:hypothetical protein